MLAQLLRADPTLAQYLINGGGLLHRRRQASFNTAWFKASCWYRPYTSPPIDPEIYPAPATLAQHLTDIGSVSDCTLPTESTV